MPVGLRKTDVESCCSGLTGVFDIAMVETVGANTLPRHRLDHDRRPSFSHPIFQTAPTSSALSMPARVRADVDRQCDDDYRHSMVSIAPVPRECGSSFMQDRTLWSDKIRGYSSWITDAISGSFMQDD